MFKRLNKILLPLFAVGMLSFAIYHVVQAQQKPPKLPPPLEPARTPFGNTVAGAGIVEARSQNIAVGSALSGVVLEVYYPRKEERSPRTREAVGGADRRVRQAGRSALPRRGSAVEGAACLPRGQPGVRAGAAGKAGEDAAPGRRGCQQSQEGGRRSHRFASARSGRARRQIDRFRRRQRRTISAASSQPQGGADDSWCKPRRT